MEAIGIALSAAQTLFASLHCSELKQMCSIFGMESQLNEFQKTVETVKAVLLDADKKDNIPYQKTQLYIKHLKSVVYDADDLLDEFVTLAQQKQHMEGEKASQKLSIFLSRRNPFLVAYKMSKKVKKIRRKLDAIASNHNNFGFSVDSQPIRRRKEETCSYVYDGKVIGREDDVEKIIGLLLDSSKQEDVSFLPIVGIGGLGKTALAQLVFNDVRLTSAFPLMLWTDVADHDQEQLDVNGILRRILASAIGRKDEESTMDRVQSLLREKLERNKYFLVLDDVWTEDRNQWQELEGFLLGGQKGSRIMVTTRSHDTARIIRDDVVYELQGLSKENSWLLFEKIAFKPGQSKACEDLIHIGREIVEQCSGVPLAIRVAGSLVYGHDKSKWLSFQNIGLFNSREGQKNIMPILKLSYDQLEPPLRSCVTYCAVFPKDFKIKKEFLISLWMAQGFIVPLDEGQRVEDAAEEYFTILLRRCFFQNINLNKFGEIYSCKMHDLMHDMTQKLAGKEVCVTDSAINNIDEEVRHLSFTGAVDEPHTFPQTHIRSYFSITKSTHQDLRMRQQSVEALVANWVCLRVLQLRYMKSLPDSIGNLCHLRFLDVAYNYQLEVLPKSITKLYNLETLKLNYCLYLKELPRDVSKLVKLRILDLEGCKQLNHMLRGLSKLVFVHKLGMILVKSSSWKQLFEELEELRDLRSLKGYLDIEINFPCNNDAEINEGDIRRGAYLSNKEHVNFINIKFNGIECEEGALRLMEELQPHFNLKRLLLVRYYGVRMPSWARENKLKTFLPNLISLELKESRIKYMTGLGNLPHLESLKLVCLKELEYIIDYSVESTASATAGLSTAEGSLLFPSLKKLHLWVLPMLKWWRRSRIGVEDNEQVLIDNSSNNMEPKLLPQLMELKISKCPNLECNLLCPVLEKLHLREFDKRLQIRSNVSLSLSHCSNMLASSFFNIREVEIDDAEWFLNSQPSLDAFQFLTGLLIEADKEVENLGTAMSRLTTLSILKIGQCPKLRSVSGALQHLTSLKEFEIRDCPNVSLAEGALSLPSFSHSLNRLSLRDLPKLVDLPNWMQFLEALQTLLIYNCQGLESLPNWMHKLTSLKELIIWNGSARLHERCQHPTGEDWPHIQHIPSIKFY